MEEDEYKATYNEIAAVRCEFEKALTNHCCKCSLSAHFCLADREGYACNSDKSAAICAEILQNVRDGSRFLLKLQRTGEPLPHNMEIRVQTGAMNGIQKLIDPERAGQKVNDIVSVIDQVLVIYGDTDKLPYSEIVQSVAATKVRKRSKNKKQ